MAILAVIVILGVGACAGPSADPEPQSTRDRTADLQQQFDSLQPGDTLTLPSGVLNHSGVLEIRVPDVHIIGSDATLKATNDETSAVKIDADRVRLTGLRLEAPTTGKRWTALDQHKLVVSGTGDVVEDVVIHGSAGAGVFVNGAQDFTINDVVIDSTRADGVHMTNGSRNGTVERVRTSATGDDGVAVVSYASDPALSGDITISDVEVMGTRYGRGITVVGGENVTVDDFSVAQTQSAGVYVANEGDPFYTSSVRGVTYSNGRIRQANTSPVTRQGALMVFSGNAGQSVRDVTFSDIEIANTPETAGRNVAIVTDAPDSIGSIRFTDLALRRSGSAQPIYAQVPRTAYATTGWTQDGRSLALTD